jgi:hypothetical protein
MREQSIYPGESFRQLDPIMILLEFL